MRKDRNTCPFFRFLQNPTTEKGRGSMLCDHASPNIGETGKHGKYCNEGKWLGPGSDKKCRILTNFLKESSYQETLI